MPRAERDFLMKLLVAEKPAVHTVPSGGQKMSCCLFRVNRSKCRLVELNNFLPLLLEGVRSAPKTTMFPLLSVWINSFPRHIMQLNYKNTSLI